MNPLYKGKLVVEVSRGVLMRFEVDVVEERRNFGRTDLLIRAAHTGPEGPHAWVSEGRFIRDDA